MLNIQRFRRSLRRRSGRLWCRARSGSTGFQGRAGRLWCRARSGSTGFRESLGGLGAEPGQVQQDLRPFDSRKAS